MPKLARFLSIAGAFVLAITFVVHDQLGERAKDSVSELRIIDLQDGIRQRFEDISKQLWSMRQVVTIKSKENILVEFEEIPTKKNEADRAVYYYQTRMKSAREEYGDLKPLVDVVRSDKRLENIKKQGIDEEETKAANADKAAADAADKYSPADEFQEVNAKDRPLTQLEYAAVKELGEQVVVVETSVNTLSRLVREAAKDKMRRDKTSDENFTMLTYFLYPFGSLMVIAGKVLEPMEKPNDVDVLA